MRLYSDFILLLVFIQSKSSFKQYYSYVFWLSYYLIYFYGFSFDKSNNFIYIHLLASPVSKVFRAGPRLTNPTLAIEFGLPTIQYSFGPDTGRPITTFSTNSLYFVSFFTPFLCVFLLFFCVFQYKYQGWSQGVQQERLSWQLFLKIHLLYVKNIYIPNLYKLFTARFFFFLFFAIYQS